MRIRVDGELCTGHAQCNAAGPDVYALDDAGFNVFRGQEVECPAGLEAQAERGALNCPEHAITLET